MAFCKPSHRFSAYSEYSAVLTRKIPASFDFTRGALRVFLNGAELKTFIDAVTMQGNETRYFDLTPFSSLLRPGTNTLAVQIGNYWSDYDDVAFDVCLKAVPYHPVAPQLSILCSDTNSPLLFFRAPPMTLWQLQSRDSLSSGNWQLLNVFTQHDRHHSIFNRPRNLPGFARVQVLPRCALSRARLVWPLTGINRLPA